MSTVEYCCCCELETGGLVLGWLGIIANGIAAIVYLYKLIDFSCMPCGELAENMFITGFATGFYKDDCETMKTNFLAITGVFFGFCVIGFTINILLCIGIRDRNHKFILPRIIVDIVALVFVLFIKIISISILAFVHIIIYAALSIYFIIVTISLYIRFKNEYLEKQRSKLDDPLK